MKHILISTALLLSINLFGQVPDSTSVNIPSPADSTAAGESERTDSLGAAFAVGHQKGNYLLKSRDIRTETISAAGLCKMACCNLAESFENSASVSVGYSDAVTGARQIRLLGQSGIYTQMLDENRPIMRGLSSPWGLTFIPSQWLESIQIAKGVTSVINGVESMTGQINLEHRKPTDEKPLYVQASYMSDTKADLNIASSLQLDEDQRWSTVILGHVDGNFRQMDNNGDGFADDPKQLDFSLANRWLYYGPGGTQVRFGVRALQDKRSGGQMASSTASSQTLWRSDILNRQLGGYVKVGVPLNEDNSLNVAGIADYTYQDLTSTFGLKGYNALQHSAFVNLLLQDQRIDQHHITVGLSEMLDVYDETLTGIYLADPSGKVAGQSTLSDLGVFGEYNFHSEDQSTFSAIVGLRADWYNVGGLKFSPRLTLKWTPIEQLVLRANGGRGLRYSTPITDNIGILSTTKNIGGDIMNHTLEDAWTFGGNLTWYLPFDEKQTSYISLDYFGTRFAEQLLVDYVGENSIVLRPLSSIPGGISRTDNFQLDVSSELFRGFVVTLTGRYTDARQTLAGCKSGEKPMVSKYKGVLNLQYATRLNKWIFDFTASINGPCRLWDFIPGEYSDMYPLLFAQITKRFKGFDIYIGGENLTNFKQENPIINAATPFEEGFDASCIWGPLSGIKIYGGIRMTIWKKE